VTPTDAPPTSNPTAKPTGKLTLLEVVYHYKMEQTPDAAPAPTEFKLPEIRDLKVQTGVTETVVPPRAKRGSPGAFKSFLKKRLADLKKIVAEETKEKNPGQTEVAAWNKKQPLQAIHFVGLPAQVDGLTDLYNEMEKWEVKLQKLRGSKVGASLEDLINAQAGGQ
jgi:hypothetical protein